MNQILTTNLNFPFFLGLNFPFVEDCDKNKSHKADNPKEKDGMRRAYLLKKGSELRKNEPESQSSHRND